MRIAAISLVMIGTVFCLLLGSISVDTKAPGTAAPGTYSDPNFTSGASISSGGSIVSTLGSPSYALPSGALSGSETSTPGSTTVNSSISLSNANGNLKDNFVYNIGPISGSDNLFSAPLVAPSAPGHPAPGVDPGVGVVPSVESTSGPGVNATPGFDIGTPVDQSINAKPAVTYGNLIWDSGTQADATTGTAAIVPGLAGTVANTPVNPRATLSFASDTQYTNILPEIRLDAPVSSNSDVAVPASNSTNWDLLGFGGSDSWPKGDLVSHSTGNETCQPVASCVIYVTAATAVEPIPVSNGIPREVPRSIAVTGGGGASPGAYDNTNLSLVFPGDANESPVCGPVGTPASECINQVAVSSTPEPRAYILLGIGLLLLAGGMRRRKSAE